MDGRVEQLQHWDNFHAVTFSPKGALFALGGHGEIMLWDIENAAALKRINAHEGQISALAFSSDGKFLASGGEDKSVLVFEIPGGKLSCSFEPHNESIQHLLFSGDGGTLAASGENKIDLWNIESQSPVGTIPTRGNPFIFSNDSRTLFVASDEMSLWQVSTGEELLRFAGYGIYTSCLALSPNGTFLAQGGGYRDENAGIIIWEAASSEAVVAQLDE